jgi:hypothetical protein
MQKKRQKSRRQNKESKEEERGRKESRDENKDRKTGSEKNKNVVKLEAEEGIKKKIKRGRGKERM